MVFFLFMCAVLLTVDTVYSIAYFGYTYMLEIKRRFGVLGRGLPIEYREQISKEIQIELGTFRRNVQAAYVPWFVLCCFVNLWYLPVIITGLLAATNNLFYRRPYISPYMLLFNLTVMCGCYAYTIVYLALQYHR
jgi:hypothetical protein